MQTSGNKILLTGGATGIGLALAELLVKAGNEVAICGRREEKLAEAKSKLPSLRIKQCDVSKATDRIELVNWVIAEFADINILINNAGIQQVLDFNMGIEYTTISKEIETNLEAPIHLAALVIPHLIKHKEAAIINVTSGLAFIPLAVVPVYCATKAALHSFSISLRHQLKNTPVKVFEIVPPIVDTDLDKGNLPKNKGITAMQAAEEAFKAIEHDKFIFTIGLASNLYNASGSNQGETAFDRMNSD